MSKSVFERLSSVNVRDRVEQKNGLDYLSWANAWAMLKKEYPDAQRTVYEAENGMNYFTDGAYAFVKVGITVDGMEHIDYLPVLDYRNKAIQLDSMTAFDVNKAIQRSTAKAIAMHGLGLTLWTGEDIPEAVAEATQPPIQKERLEVDSDAWKRVTAYVEANKEMALNDILAQLRRKYVVSAEAKQAISEMLNQ